MRIFTKKAFGFVNPDVTKEVNGAREVVKTTPLGFHDVPDWVAEDDMFKWGKTDGDIEVIATEVKVAASETKEENKEVKVAADATKTETKEEAKPAGWVAADAAKDKK